MRLEEPQRWLSKRPIHGVCRGMGNKKEERVEAKKESKKERKKETAERTKEEI